MNGTSLFANGIEAASGWSERLAMPWHELSGDIYEVEVSGWDEFQNFFVETAKLYWHAGHGKTTRLRSRIHLGSIVFIRLAEPLSMSSNFPVAYQVDKVSLPNPEGYFEIALVQLKPNKDLRRGADRFLPAAEMLSAIH